MSKIRRSDSPEDPLLVAAVFGLVIMAVWTLVVKFLVPILFYYSSNGDGTLPIMWDFWWVAHLFLARLLWTRSVLAWRAALVISLVEIAIVVTKFVMFAVHPENSLWALLWFTNKVYVLAFFVVLLDFLLTGRFSREIET